MDKIMNVGLYPSCTIINARSVMDLDVKHKTIKLLNRQIGEKIWRLRASQGVYRHKKKTIHLKKCIKLDIIKIENVVAMKDLRL